MLRLGNGCPEGVLRTSLPFPWIEIERGHQPMAVKNIGRRNAEKSQVRGVDPPSGLGGIQEI